MLLDQLANWRKYSMNAYFFGVVIGTNNVAYCTQIVVEKLYN